VTALAAGAACVLACTGIAPDAGAFYEGCSDADSDPTHDVVFGRDVRPLIARTRLDPTGPGCVDCHYVSLGTRQGILIGGLDLETLGSLRRGGARTGANIVVPGKPCSSGIVKKLLGTFEGPRMPKDSPRSWNDDEMHVIMDWIAEGAKGADSE
jgi:hypothetical protein